VSATLEDVLHVVVERRRDLARQHGWEFEEPTWKPCTSEEIAEMVALAQSEIGIAVPPDYLSLLKLTRRFGTQWGSFFDPRDFLAENFQQWCTRSTVLSSTGEFRVSVQGRFATDRERVQPTYALLGQNSNQDSFVYRYATNVYEITGFSFREYVYESFPSLAALINHIGREG
jgi:hypothetical protein